MTPSEDFKVQAEKAVRYASDLNGVDALSVNYFHKLLLEAYERGLKAVYGGCRVCMPPKGEGPTGAPAAPLAVIPKRPMYYEPPASPLVWNRTEKRFERLHTA